MPVEHKQIKLAVTGMSCNGCSSRVQKALESVKGVISAHVDLKGASAVVEVATPGPTAGQLADAVTNIGYDARPVEK
jgi:Cu+-exporting ATPase